MNMENIKVGNISLVGKRHSSTGQLCQDRSFSVNKMIVTNPNSDNPGIERVACVIVSDGVGSESYSDIGAEYAVESISHNIEWIYSNIVLPQTNEDWDKSNEANELLLKNIRSAAIKYAERIGTTKEDIATTLSFAIMGEKWTFVHSLGDSPICVKMKNRPLEVHVGNNCEHANETVVAFSSTSWECRYAEMLPSDEIEGIFIISDGAGILTRLRVDSDPLHWIKGIINKEDTIESIAKEIVGLQNDDVSISYIYPIAE